MSNGTLGVERLGLIGSNHQIPLPHGVQEAQGRTCPSSELSQVWDSGLSPLRASPQFGITRVGSCLLQPRVVRLAPVTLASSHGDSFPPSPEPGFLCPPGKGGPSLQGPRVTKSGPRSSWAGLGHQASGRPHALCQGLACTRRCLGVRSKS